jgi:zinc transporter ZupT
MAICGIAIGVGLGSERRLPAQVTAAGGALLFGISVFFILPEMAESAGWPIGAAALAAGGILLWGIDRYLYPICPSCSHEHDHTHCSKPPLHGFAVPLLIASGIHSLLDGWSIRLLSTNGITGWAAPLGLALHKVPEGIALGLIAREALTSARRAFLICTAIESLTLVGAALEPVADKSAAAHFGVAWMTLVLAATGGSFLFLGFHTVHVSRKVRGVVPTFLLTLCGLAAVAYLG